MTPTTGSGCQMRNLGPSLNNEFACLLLVLLAPPVLGALLEDDALHQQEEPLVDAVRANLGENSTHFEIAHNSASMSIIS